MGGFSIVAVGSLHRGRTASCHTRINDEDHPRGHHRSAGSTRQGKSRSYLQSDWDVHNRCKVERGIISHLYSDGDIEVQPT